MLLIKNKFSLNLVKHLMTKTNQMSNNLAMIEKVLLTILLKKKKQKTNNPLMFNNKN